MKKIKKTEFGNIITPFYKMGTVTYKILNKFNIFNSYFKKLGESLSSIYPKYSKKEIIEIYVSYKFMSVYAFLAAGIILFLVYSFSFSNGNKITELNRQDFWGDDIQQSITAKANNTESTFDITISHQEISEETLRKIMEQKAEQLPSIILGDNKSLDLVNSSLNLVSEIPNTQINVYWEVEENDVLLPDGKLVIENIKDAAVPIKLRAILSYDDISVDTEFYVNVVKPKLSKEEKLKSDISQLIKEADNSTVSYKSLVLPKEVDGKKITYTQQEEKGGKIIFLIMFSICVPLLFFAQDEKLGKQKMNRENQMIADYPEIISKLILYLGAGLTIQGAFEMIASNYIQEKNKNKLYERFAYEEIVFLCREVQGGVSFSNSLENFSVRCQVLSFRKLSMLLLQNLKKGSNELIGLLRNEAVSAFDTRKSTAKRLGEEAGTKMLLPMIMSLGVVLVILIVPAWISFQM